MPNPTITASAVDRFNAKVDKSPGHGPRGDCWLWTAFIHPGGYGMFCVGGRARRTNRVAWAIANGRWPRPGMFICHTCDIRHCVNPGHLWEGTRAQNIADMVAKGRARSGGEGRYGDLNSSVKLPDSELPRVFELRSLGLSAFKIGQLVGLSETQVYRILKGVHRRRGRGWIR